LAHFAYFGTPNGGGNTVRDPQGNADDEAPNFVQALGDVAGAGVAMIEHLTAIQAALASLGYPTHRIYAAKPAAQYLVLGGRAWDGTGEPALAGPVRDIETDLRVTAVAGTPDGVAIMLRRVRDVLSPGGVWHRVPMTGWRLDTRFLRSEFIDVDTSTTNAASGLHPAFGVDSYQLAAQAI
jgi:hypothetical protein